MATTVTVSRATVENGWMRERKTSVMCLKVLTEVGRAKAGRLAGRRLFCFCLGRAGSAPGAVTSESKRTG